MPLHCVGEKRSPAQTDDDSDEDGIGEVTRFWQGAPDSILLHIFGFLDVRDLGLTAQTCKTWKRISFDESLWRNLLRGYLGLTECGLPAGKKSWRSEVKRFINHRPVLLTETLHDHLDEVLHVSFSHDGKLFSTTSKDATLKIWTLGSPTTLKYSKDFRDLLGWDFTQYSCFNESDTMILVSSVKTTAYMDRRGYMAVLSLIHDFEILRIVTMDPSQLFGAWLDDTTFLGGSLEISLDRFATTVQIEAYDVPEIYSPMPHPISPVVEESSGQTLFTFSSETASLIKFLTVAMIESPHNGKSKVKAKQEVSAGEKTLIELSPSIHACHTEQPSCSYNVELKNESIKSESECLSYNDKSVDYQYSSEEHEYSNVYNQYSSANNSGMTDGGSHYSQFKEDVGGNSVICSNCLDLQAKLDPDIQDSNLTFQSKALCDGCILKNSNLDEGEITINYPGMKQTDTVVLENKYKQMLENKESHMSVYKRPSSFVDHFEGNYNQSFPDSFQDIKATCNTNTNNSFCDKKQLEMQQKNLIFVTGEFAVALHQLGFKNVPPYAKESVLARGITPMDEDNPESFMVVNYSNNDIHFVQRQQEPDKPDNLLDLHGHVTGLCLTSDQRYLFINCRPWIGNVDRTDPWATPDLSPNIEIRIIDLVSLQDLGVRYMGHKGFSPSNMCCFVFLDVSEDYVASGSEDSLGYLWDKHYGALVAKFEHESGVVNAVGFNPKNQEILVTVSDDGTVKIWRSKQEANSFFDNV